MFGGRLQWQEPDDVALLDDGSGPVDCRARHHRRPRAGAHAGFGDVPATRVRPTRLSGLDVAPSQTVLSGDVLFAGSIGRTDLPGGSHAQMLDSLRNKVLPACRRQRRASGSRGSDDGRAREGVEPLSRRSRCANRVTGSRGPRPPTRGL